MLRRLPANKLSLGPPPSGQAWDLSPDQDPPGEDATDIGRSLHPLSLWLRRDTVTVSVVPRGARIAGRKQGSPLPQLSASV